MAVLYAVHKITRATGEFEATGAYDEQGNPVVKIVSQSEVPGTIFEMEAGEELDALQSAGAVRDPTEAEALLWAKVGRTQ
jgi:hypothetical protein